jgi:hypothetical protein
MAGRGDRIGTFRTDPVRAVAQTVVPGLVTFVGS